jgi:hypothetical protein
VHSNGKRDGLSLTHAEALAYATSAAKEFGVGEGKEVVFDTKLALSDIKGEGDVKSKKVRSAKAGAADSAEKTQ